MLRAIVFLLFLLLSQAASAAGDVAPQYKKVIGQAQSAGAPLAMSTKYGDGLKYQVAAGLASAGITVTGLDVSLLVDWRAEIKEAFDEWNTGAMKGRLSSDEAAAGESPGVTFDVDTTVSTDETTYGGTVIRGSPSTIKINLRNIGRNAQRGYNDLTAKGVLASTVTLEKYVRMLVRLTLKHEIGHALGLAHTSDVPGSMSASLYENLEILPEGVSIGEPIGAVAPSIMLPGAVNYFTLLSQHLGRSISILDLQVSANDLNGAHFMWNGITYSRARAFVSRMAFACLGARSTCP